MTMLHCNTTQHIVCAEAVPTPWGGGGYLSGKAPSAQPTKFVISELIREIDFEKLIPKIFKKIVDFRNINGNIHAMTNQIFTLPQPYLYPTEEWVG